jgi:Uma2 family endonuclease
MTWAEILEDKLLNRIDWKIESDRFGNVVMSPPPRSRHAEYQGEILRLLLRELKDGLALPECPIETSEGVKAADIAWVSRKRRASRPNDPVYLIAPEICVQVMSPSNSEEELEERKRLFFEKGAVEFWVCDLLGNMTFSDGGGALVASKLCPKFQAKLEIG